MSDVLRHGVLSQALNTTPPAKLCAPWPVWIGSPPGDPYRMFVVELNRGKQIRAFVHRAGTKDPPQSGYDDTALYGMSVPARGTALKLALPAAAP